MEVSNISVSFDPPQKAAANSINIEMNPQHSALAAQKQNNEIALNITLTRKNASRSDDNEGLVMFWKDITTPIKTDKYDPSDVVVSSPSIVNNGTYTTTNVEDKKHFDKLFKQDSGDVTVIDNEIPAKYANNEASIIDKNVLGNEEVRDNKSDLTQNEPVQNQIITDSLQKLITNDSKRLPKDNSPEHEKSVVLIDNKEQKQLEDGVKEDKSDLTHNQSIQNQINTDLLQKQFTDDSEKLPKDNSPEPEKSVVLIDNKEQKQLEDGNKSYLTQNQLVQNQIITDSLQKLFVNEPTKYSIDIFANNNVPNFETSVKSNLDLFSNVNESLKQNADGKIDNNSFNTEIPVKFENIVEPFVNDKKANESADHNNEANIRINCMTESASDKSGQELIKNKTDFTVINNESDIEIPIHFENGTSAVNNNKELVISNDDMSEIANKYNIIQNENSVKLSTTEENDKQASKDNTDIKNIENICEIKPSTEYKNKAELPVQDQELINKIADKTINNNTFNVEIPIHYEDDKTITSKELIKDTTLNDNVPKVVIAQENGVKISHDTKEEDYEKIRENTSVNNNESNVEILVHYEDGPSTILDHKEQMKRCENDTVITNMPDIVQKESNEELINTNYKETINASNTIGTDSKADTEMSNNVILPTNDEKQSIEPNIEMCVHYEKMPSALTNDKEMIESNLNANKNGDLKVDTSIQNQTNDDWIVNSNTNKLQSVESENIDFANFKSDISIPDKIGVTSAEIYTLKEDNKKNLQTDNNESLIVTSANVIESQKRPIIVNETTITNGNGNEQAYDSLNKGENISNTTTSDIPYAQINEVHSITIFPDNTNSFAIDRQITYPDFKDWAMSEYTESSRADDEYFEMDDDGNVDDDGSTIASVVSDVHGTEHRQALSRGLRLPAAAIADGTIDPTAATLVAAVREVTHFADEFRDKIHNLTPDDETLTRKLEIENNKSITNSDNIESSTKHEVTNGFESEKRDIKMIENQNNIEINEQSTKSIESNILDNNNSSNVYKNEILADIDNINIKPLITESDSFIKWIEVHSKNDENNSFNEIKNMSEKSTNLLIDEKSSNQTTQPPSFNSMPLEREQTQPKELSGVEKFEKIAEKWSGSGIIKSTELIDFTELNKNMQEEQIPNTKNENLDNNIAQAENEMEKPEVSSLGHSPENRVRFVDDEKRKFEADNKENIVEDYSDVIDEYERNLRRHTRETLDLVDKLCEQTQELSQQAKQENRIEDKSTSKALYNENSVDNIDSAWDGKMFSDTTHEVDKSIDIDVDSMRINPAIMVAPIDCLILPNRRLAIIDNELGILILNLETKSTIRSNEATQSSKTKWRYPKCIAFIPDAEHLLVLAECCSINNEEKKKIDVSNIPTFEKITEQSPCDYNLFICRFDAKTLKLIDRVEAPKYILDKTVISCQLCFAPPTGSIYLAVNTLYDAYLYELTAECLWIEVYNRRGCSFCDLQYFVVVGPVTELLVLEANKQHVVMLLLYGSTVVGQRMVAVTERPAAITVDEQGAVFAFDRANASIAQYSQMHFEKIREIALIDRAQCRISARERLLAVLVPGFKQLKLYKY